MNDKNGGTYAEPEYYKNRHPLSNDLPSQKIREEIIFSSSEDRSDSYSYSDSYSDSEEDKDSIIACKSFSEEDEPKEKDNMSEQGAFKMERMEIEREINSDSELMKVNLSKNKF